MARIGQHAGMGYAPTPYCIRRKVCTDLTDAGVSEAQRNSILGHRNSATFLKHCLSSSSAVEVQAMCPGVLSGARIFREIEKLCLRRGTPAKHKL